MADEPHANSGFVGELRRNLGPVFRHLLPGVFILGAAYAAHPSWFAGLDSRSWQHISIAAAIALTSGNVWFAFNRHAVHQMIDYLAYLFRSQGPVPTGSRKGYIDDLGRYVAEAVSSGQVSERAREHVSFRAASVLLLYIVAEVGILFAIWHEPNTLFDQHPCAIIAAALMTLAAGLWQNVITRRIDYYVVHPPRG